MRHLTYRDEEGTPHWSKELMEDDTGWAGELIRSTVADMEDAVEKPRLDRSAWEPCRRCKTCESCKSSICSTDDKSSGCYKRDHMENYEPMGFCPRCGRPLTDAAWEMLEKRLEGRK